MARLITISLTALLLVFAISPDVIAAAASSDSYENQEPEVVMTTPASYTAQKIALFPLDIPGYAMRALTWPIGAVIRTMEEKHLGKRIFDLLSNKEHTFWVYPYIEGAPGPGFGGGLGFVHTDLFHSGWRMSGRYDVRINLNQYGRFYIEKADIARLFDRPLFFHFESNFSHDNNDDYYGIGPNTKRSDLATYKNNVVTNLAKLDYQIAKHFGAGIRFTELTEWNSSAATGGSPGVADKFPASQLIGLGRTLNYLIPGIEAWYDSRDNTQFPNRGGRYSAGFARYQCLNANKVDFNQYTVDLEHAFPLWRPRLALLLRNAWVFQQRTGGSKVPFNMLAVLDYSSPLRGFSRGRFQDRSSVVFNAEYRYPVWNVVDGVLFFDTGRVFRTISGFSFDDFKFDGGGGLRFRYLNLALFSLDVGYGGEGVKVMFGIQKML